VARSEKVIIIAEDTEYWPIHSQRNFLARNFQKSTADVDYVAVYQTRPVSAITHYGKVKSIQERVSYREIYAETQFENREGYAKVYTVEEFVELPRKIVFDRERDGSPVRSREYCTLDDLFCSKSLRDIREAQKQGQAK